MNQPYRHGRVHRNPAPLELPNDPSQQFTNAMQDIVAAMTKPSVIYQPDLELDKKSLRWRASYGDFSVYGPTPGLAMSNFDSAWMTRKTFDASTAGKE
jgi:hypothetical protein